MNIKKIKEMLQNKKVVAISSVVAGALIIAVVGTMILNNKDIKNNIAIENESEEIEQPKELEEKLVSSNLSEEEVVVENEVDTLAEKEPVSTNDENSTSNKEDTESTTTEKVGTSNNSSNNTNTSNNSNNSSSSSGVVSNTNTHTHTWVEVYKDVAHAEEGHWENMVVKEAWTESIPVHEDKIVGICNGCGKDITGKENSHMKEQMLAGNYSCGSWRDDVREVQVGTNTVNHPAVTENKWIVDKSAWTEKVLNGYKCNDCGVSK